MQFKNVFLGRRSIRKYKDKELPVSLVGEILDLARFSPSSGNLQNWKVVIVTDLDKRQEIADACLQQDWMVEAPVFLAICNDYKDVRKHYGKIGKMFSIQNCANFAFAVTLCATEFGVSSCWIGAFDNEAIHRILEIPEDMDPEIILTLGYANETKKPSMREDPNYLAYINEWGENCTEFPSHINKLISAEKLKKHLKKLKK